MAVDLEALKAALAPRETLEATTLEKFPTESEETQDSIVLAAQTIWALIDDLEASNASNAALASSNSELTQRITLLARTATDSRLQPPKPVRYTRAQ